MEEIRANQIDHFENVLGDFYWDDDIHPNVIDTMPTTRELGLSIDFVKEAKTMVQQWYKDGTLQDEHTHEPAPWMYRQMALLMIEYVSDDAIPPVCQCDDSSIVRSVLGEVLNLVELDLYHHELSRYAYTTPAGEATGEAAGSCVNSNSTP